MLPAVRYIHLDELFQFVWTDYIFVREGSYYVDHYCIVFVV